MICLFRWPHRPEKFQEIAGRPLIVKWLIEDLEMGDNEGNEPYTPPIGPRKGPPTREEHEPEPDTEYLASVDVGIREPDWREWRMIEGVTVQQI